MKLTANHNIVATILAFGLVVNPLLVAFAADPASGDQIQALLSGNTLQGSGSETTFSEFYDPDGTLRGKGYTGKWKVENGMGCMDYSGEGFDCWTLVIIDGPAHIWYKEGKVDAAAMMIKGNPNGY